ncbi:MAG: hypothetical protein ABL934_10505 [Lysobacteraceae bacterium]
MSLSLLRRLAASLALVAAPAIAAAPTPLAPAELQALRAELEALRQEEMKALGKGEMNLADLRARLATPDQVERLFATPAFLADPEDAKAMAFMLAGPGEALRFDKPSDVLATVAARFPAELAASRAKGASFISPSLYGPYPHWTPQSIAWMALWQCTPTFVWMEPDGSPFRREPGLTHRRVLNALGDDDDFGDCLQHGLGREHFGRDAAAQQRDKDRRQAMLARALPLLTDRLLRHLETAGCSGQGPDDCVAVLLMLSQIAPGDPRLARQLARLEPEVKPTDPLPEPLQSRERYERRQQPVGEPRHLTFLRRAAFLRAKLAVALAAGSDLALPPVLAQLSLLATRWEAAFDWRWSRYQLEQSPRFDPWAQLRRSAGHAAAFEAVLAHVDQARTAGASCETLAPWLAVAKPWREAESAWTLRLRDALAERALDHPERPACHDFDWAALREAPQSPLRDRLLARLPKASGVERERLLSGLTQNGADCLAKDKPLPAALAAVCTPWVHTPQHLALNDARLPTPLSRANAFRERSWLLPAKGSQDAAAEMRQAWAAAAEGLSPVLDPAWAAFTAQVLAEADGFQATLRQWRLAGHPQVLVEVQSNRAPLLYVLSAQGAQPVAVPARFRGERGGRGIVRVSDLDRDGRLELWWSGNFESCGFDGDDPIPRDLGCQATEADMGEIDGDSLGHFVADAPRPLGAASATLTAAWAVSGARDDACNLQLLDAWLAEPLKLKLNLGAGNEADRGDLLDWTCRPHPEAAGQWLVALFHSLVEDEEAAGFVLALVDARQGRLLRHGRMKLELDAVTRVDRFSLRLDTARYQLQPGRRAIGVRMSVDRSPNHADMGSGPDLSLFVPEGAGGYRLVLDRLPMSRWERGGNWSECQVIANSDACEVVDEKGTLELADTQTGGWRDLLLRRKVDGAERPTPTERGLGGPPQLLRMGPQGRYH